MAVAEHVRELADRAQVRVDRSSREYRQAVAFNRLEDVYGDETLDRIAALLRAKAITFAESARLTLQHQAEIKAVSDFGADVGMESAVRSVRR